MKAIFLTFLLLCSCTKYASISKESVGIRISPVTMEITHLNDINWRVGKQKEEKVTQSFTFIVDLPKVKSADLDDLIEQRGIDSWILRLIVVRRSETQDLGSLYAPFRPRRFTRGTQSSVSSVTMKVFYAAAYASERFRNFKCPAFGHNKKITEMDIEGEDEEFTLTVESTLPYQERSQLVELTPTAFNGGNSLLGEYFVEIAPYDSKNKVIHSSFKRIPMSVKVEEESSIRIKSCDGVHPELSL